MVTKNGYVYVFRKKFKGNHVYSLIKKKRMKDEKVGKEYPDAHFDFSLEEVDTTLVNMFGDYE